MSDEQETTFFPEKLLKKLPTGFTDDMESLSVDEVKKKIFEYEGNIYTIEKAKDADRKLNGAKDLVKELSAPYTEGKNTQAAQIKYCLFLLESRGVVLDKSDQ